MEVTTQKKPFRILSLDGGGLRGLLTVKILKWIEAQTGKKVNALTKRMGMHYKCKSCKNEYPAKQVQVDHIKPVVDTKIGFTSWDEFIERLYCSKDNLQVLCKMCHDTSAFFNIDFSAVTYFQFRDRLTTKDRQSNELYWIFSKGGIEYKVYKAVQSKKSYTNDTFKQDFRIKNTSQNNKEVNPRRLALR